MFTVPTLLYFLENLKSELIFSKEGNFLSILLVYLNLIRVKEHIDTLGNSIRISSFAHTELKSIQLIAVHQLKLCQDFTSTIARDKEDLQAKNSLEWLPRKQITFK